MSVCVPHPNFGCLIRHCALFRQNASGVYTSGPGPWEVSPASSRTLWIVTDLQGMEDFGLEWACGMDFYGCKAVNKLMLMLSSFSAVYTVYFPYILCVCMYVQ